MPDRALRGRRNPWELAIYISCVLSAVTFLSHAAPPPGSVAALMPRPMLLLWCGQLAAAGLIGLVANAWPRRRLATALALSRASLIFLVFAVASCTVAILIVNGRAGVGGALLIAPWGLAALCRLIQVQLDLRTITKSTRQSDGELTLHEEPPP